VPDKFSLSIGPDLFSFKFDNEDGMDTIALYAERHGLVYYEIPLPTVLAAIVRQGSGVFIDVGANTGIYSLLAAAANPVTEVFAFEPVPSIRLRLERNLSINPGLAARISVEPVALSDREGSFVIAEHVNREGFVATSSTLQPGICNSSGTSRDTQVDVTRFDTWIAPASRRPARSAQGGRGGPRTGVIRGSSTEFPSLSASDHRRVARAGQVRVLRQVPPGL
jgi:FkbM family methyltransferase